MDKLKKMHGRFLRHLANEQEKQAFIDGFRVAMDIYEHRYPSEYSEGPQSHLIDNWIITKSHYFLNGNGNGSSLAKMVGKDTVTFRRNDIYGMLSHSFVVEDDRFVTDRQNRPILDDSAEPWPLFAAVNPKTGVVIEKSAYQALSKKTAKKYQVVPYVEIYDDADQCAISRLYADDRPFIETLIEDDILDPAGGLYVKCYSILLEHAAADDPICQYRDFIEAKIAEREKLSDTAHDLIANFFRNPENLLGMLLGI